MRVAIFSNHKYDQNSFEEANGSFEHELVFLTATLDSATAPLASGFPAVCAFVNDRLDAPVLAQLGKGGTKVVALRCAGYNNVDLGAAEAHGITVVRVPAYSPHAVYERLAPLVKMSRTPTHWREPLLDVRGAARPVWEE